MKKNRLLFRSVILLVLIGAVAFTLYQNFSGDKEKVAIGSAAPNFKAVTMDGKEISLRDLRGKGVFLNFWGTWCKPCEKEMPYMNELYSVYKDKGVEIVALNADETEIAVKNFAAQYGLKFPIAIDKGQEILTTYGVVPLPTSFLIDKNGKVVDIIKGTQTKEQIEAYMKKIMP
ncbi:thiol-disulfide oxidoreductase ResA [Ectobacillus ponti]|uniref:Thiol-disulfide oxidoreductase ResA n=1 Tax=Ectobacillus ponti TaxID=2961894 RepID=A0AA41X989_9BACI|nr:thiol-disulfide oxidoreductase ResA [Ectobacillus ponti]MCP8968715.1 thiol-disulfide oxidoreductase ResA [Ectobacillus ponti]